MNHLNRILRAGLCLAIFATIIQTAIASNDAALDAERTSAIFAVPLPPIYYAPANGATGVSAPVELKFNNVAGALRYNVQVATDPGFNSIVFSTNVPHTPAVFAAPTGGVTYFWRVQTVGSSGNSTFGAAWHFTALLSRQPC